MKNKYLLAVTLLFTSLSFMAKAQHHDEVPCITDEILAEKIKTDPAIALKQQATDAAILNYGNASAKRDGGCDVRIIPCVVHIIHNNGTENISDNIVHQYIQQVNDVYGFKNVDINDVDTQWHDVVANMQIELRLAQIDPDGKPTDGIERVQSTQTAGAFDNVKSLSRWDPERYLNIWIVRTINYPGAGGTVLGYAYFPYMEESDMSNSGIVIRSDVLNRATLPHELGHYLNLYHPFQGSCGSDCETTGDRVCDTPPVFRSTSGCPMNNNTCSNDNPNTRDMIENIMDYSSCRTILTKGQKVRVDYTLENDRAKLVSIDNLFKTGVIDSTYSFGKPIADFTANSIQICEGEKIEYIDLSCTDIENTDYKWIFPSGVPSASFTRTAEVEYSKAGTYDATLIISNSAGNDTLIREDFITVIPETSTIKAPYNFDFEDTDFPYDGWSLNDVAPDVHWEITDKAANRGTYSMYINNNGIAASDQLFSVYTPEIDLTTANTFEMSFDVAYARNSIGTSERLEVYAISHCKDANLLRYQGSAFALKTTDLIVSQEFIPEDDEWQTINIDLNLIKSFTSVAFEIRFVSDGDQNIYIDNLRIGDWSAGTGTTTHSIELFPNPATDYLRIRGLEQYGQVDMTLRDITGRVVMEQVNFEANNLNISLLERGTYFAEFETDQGTFTSRFIKQ